MSPSSPPLFFHVAFKKRLTTLGECSTLSSLASPEWIASPPAAGSEKTGDQGCAGLVGVSHVKGGTVVSCPSTKKTHNHPQTTRSHNAELCSNPQTCRDRQTHARPAPRFICPLRHRSPASIRSPKTKMVSRRRPPAGPILRLWYPCHFYGQKGPQGSGPDPISCNETRHELPDYLRDMELSTFFFRSYPHLRSLTSS